MAAQPKFFAQSNKERLVAPFIPYSSHVSPDTIVTKDGDYIRMWRVGGIAHESADPETITLRKNQLNTLWRSIGASGVALWTHNVRRQTTDKLDAVFENDFCRDLDRKYYESFTGYRMMANELYLTLVYRPVVGRVGKVAVRAARRTAADIAADQVEALQKLDDLAYQIEAGMRRYDLEALGVYTHETVDVSGNRVALECSSMLEFMNFLVSGEWQRVKVPRIPLDEYLGTAWVFVGAETIELRTPLRTRYAQIIDFKDYSEWSEPGLLNNLMYEDYEYVITQSFSFLSKHDGKSFLEQQQKRLKNAEDGSLRQVEEITEAIDELVSGQFVQGEYHFSLLVFGGTVAEARVNTTSAMATIQDLGFLAALVNTATDAAFYAQLPCNWKYRPRVAGLNSRNFAGLASFHNFSNGGKRQGNPWGQAVTLFKTPSGQPLYFNFHSSRNDDEDEFDKKLAGNTRIIGKTGTGKTVLLTFLLAQSQKFKVGAPLGCTDVFFDKDRGAEIAIRAMGGKYLAIQNGEPTGFNPFQMDPTPGNIMFLEKLTRWLAQDGGPKLSTVDENRISQAVRAVMRMPKPLRRIYTVTQNMTEGDERADRDNSVVKRLMRWCEGGPLAWVLDNHADQLDFTTHSSYGFDGTDFLDNELVRAPIAMYLLHRMDSVIDGRRFSYWMDEFWKWIDDEAFGDFGYNQQKTIRKKNGFGVFCTQSPSEVLQSPYASAIVEQCATEIYLPNPKADFKEYTEGFKLTHSEFEIVKSFDEESRMFLIKQGHRSAIGQLDLQGFDDELGVLSGSTDNSALLRDVMAQVGENPADWLPLFQERRKARAGGSKSIVRQP